MRIINKIKIGAFTFLCGALMPFANAQISIAPATLGNFTATTGNASNAQALTLTATGPSGAIVVSAPEGFEVSKNATTGFARSITLGTPGGSIQSVYKGGFATHTGSVWYKGSGSEFPNDSYFAAVTANGSVVASDESSFTEVAQNLTSNVLAIYSNAESFAALKSNGSVLTWGNPSSGGNSTVLSALNLNGNWTVTEGESVAGKLSSNVTTISSSKYAYAALKENGSVVTWGRIVNGGNSTAVLKYEKNDSWVLTEGPSLTGLLSSNVSAVHSNWGAFAALKKNGSVVTWGEFNKGGNASVTQDFYGNNGNGTTTTEVKSVAGQLASNVTNIYSNYSAFAALKKNGSVVTWGDLESGGNSSVISGLDVSGNWTITERQSVASKLASNVETIYSNSGAFAALKNDGSVVTWGALYAGGNSSVVTFLDGAQNDSVIEGASVSGLLSSNVTNIYSNLEAFAALKNNGSVVTWGDLSHGGNSTVVVPNTNNGTETGSEVVNVSASLASGVVAVYSNEKAFAALKENGSVVTWGNAAYGGNSTITKSGGNWPDIPSGGFTEGPSVAGLLSSNVTAVYSTSRAFAALKKDGSVVAWGDVAHGGNLTSTILYVNHDGSMTWGEFPSVSSQLSSGVLAIYSAGGGAFLALKNDGSIVPWGFNSGNFPTPTNIGASTSGLPAQIYVRLASASQVSSVSGDLVFSSLGTEIESRPLSGSFTGSSDTGRSSAVGGGVGGATEVKKSKKGKGKSSAKKAGGGSKKSSASKPTGGKKSGVKKSKK